MKKVDLTLPRRKGPFFLRKLKLKELFDFFRKIDADGEEERIKKLVQMTLVTGAGKQVYSEKQLDAMEDELGAVALLSLGMEAQRVNEMEKLADFAGRVESAEKN